MLRPNRAKKVGGRGIKIPSGTVVNEDLPSPLWQFNDLAKSLNGESSDEEKDDGTSCSRTDIELYRTDGEMWRFG